MHGLIGNLRMDLRRGIASPRMAAAVLCAVGINFLTISQELTLGSQSVGILYYYGMFESFGAFSVLRCFLAALPFATSYCEDWNSRYLHGCVIRSSPESYACSRAISVALSGFLATIMGYLLTFAILAIRMPILSADAGQNEIYLSEAGFGTLLPNHPVLFLLLHVFVSGLNYGFWAVFALCVSGVLPNPFLVLASPVIGWYVLVNLSDFLCLPGSLHINIAAAGTAHIQGVLPTIAFSGAYFGVLTLIVGYLFCRRVKWRMANE